MRRLFVACRLLAVGALVLATGAKAQTSAAKAANPATNGWVHGAEDISKGWLVHLGDDAAYAEPGFDDTGWEKVDLHSDPLPSEIVEQGHARWYRLHLHLPAEPGTTTLLLTGQAGSFEVYVDGKRTGAPIRPSFFWIPERSTIYALPAGASIGDMVIAVRSHSYNREFGSDGDLTDAFVGNSTAIEWVQSSYMGGRLNAFVFSIAVYLLTFTSGALLLLLFAKQRSHHEYLWLGLTLIFAGLGSVFIGLQFAGLIPASINAMFGDPSVYFWVVAQLEFAYVFTGKRPGRVVRLYEGLLIVAPFFLDPAYWLALLPFRSFDIVENSLFLPGICLLGVMLIVWWRQGSREAGILVVPWLLSALGAIMFNVQDFSTEYGLGWNVMPSFHLGPVRFALWDICQLLYLLAIGSVLFSRFLRVSREQARSAAELEAARVVQQVLLPEPNAGMAGFRIEAEYLPAQEVGGDFYQIIPTAEGGLMMVTGDVSGKGMPAAMLVALLVGAIRTEAAHTSDPSVLLETLNRRVYGRMSSGFATCVALHVLPDGRAVLANAANPSPYLNGVEMELAGALPLGLVAKAEYANYEFLLKRGDGLVFVSDGVIEAADATGDLLGFERTRAMSMLPAGEIVERARSFGQSDDITVVSVVRLEALHA